MGLPQSTQTIALTQARTNATATNTGNTMNSAANNTTNGMTTTNSNTGSTSSTSTLTTNGNSTVTQTTTTQQGPGTPPANLLPSVSLLKAAAITAPEGDSLGCYA